MASDLSFLVKQKTIQQNLKIVFDPKRGRFSMPSYSFEPIVPDILKVSYQAPLDADVVPVVKTKVLMSHSEQIQVFIFVFKRFFQIFKKAFLLSLMLGLGFFMFGLALTIEFSTYNSTPSFEKQQTLSSSNSLTISPSCLGALSQSFCHRIYQNQHELPHKDPDR